MHKYIKTFIIIFSFILSFITLSADKASPPTSEKEPIKIYWWHSMGGKLGLWVNDLAAGFNAKNPEYQIIPAYKGNYAEAMNAAIAAFRSKQQPHIVQVYEVGTATMMAAKGAVYPFHELMRKSGIQFDKADYLDAIIGYYETSDGEMLSMPFNSSTPVLFYNKEWFKKAGLDPSTPPKTFEELESFSKKLMKAGCKHGFTTAWQSWIQFENFSAWHNLPFGTDNNGFSSTSPKLIVNSKAHLHHIKTLQEWAKKGIFVYGGRKDDALEKFLSGEAAIFMQSSAGYASIQSRVKFDFGIGMLPYWKKLTNKPQNSIIGGATLWTLRGHSDAEYKGVAKFFDYISSPEIQALSHQNTGYLPLTHKAYELTKKSGYYKKNTGLEIPILQLTLNKPTVHSKGLRFGYFVQIRDIINNELEAVWSQHKTPEQALSVIVEKGNALLNQFSQIHQ